MVKKIFTLVMVISVLGAFAAGCGSKTDDSGTTGTTATGTTATTGGTSTTTGG